VEVLSHHDVRILEELTLSRGRFSVVDFVIGEPVIENVDEFFDRTSVSLSASNYDGERRFDFCHPDCTITVGGFKYFGIETGQISSVYTTVLTRADRVGCNPVSGGEHVLMRSIR